MDLEEHIPDSSRILSGSATIEVTGDNRFQIRHQDENGDIIEDLNVKCPAGKTWIVSVGITIKES